MKLLLFSLLLSSFAYCGTYEPTTTDKSIINYTFNEDFDQAKKIIDGQIKLNPGIPKYYYYSINLKVLEYYKRITDLDPANRDEGRRIINKEIIDYCEGVINKFDPAKLNVENKFYLGSIYGYLARIYGLDKSWWSAFKSGGKAEDIMKDVLKNDPQFYDANLVLGMLNYYADRLSGITSFVAGILGFSGDRDKGLQQLKLAYDKGMLSFGQASLTLIEVYGSLEDKDDIAIDYYEKFLKQFPYNKRVLNAYLQKLLNAWEIKKADAVVKNDDHKLLDDYTIAMYYDFKGNEEQALFYAEKALQDKKRIWRGWLDYTYYLAAVNCYLLGDISKSDQYAKELEGSRKEYFNLIKKYPAEFKWLFNFSTQAANFITILEFENLLKTMPTAKTKEFEDQCNITAGKFYFYNNVFNKAEMYFNKCLNSEETGIKYTSLKYLTDIYLSQNTDKKKVEKLVDSIDDFDNDRLIFRAKDLEKKYNL